MGDSVAGNEDSSSPPPPIPLALSRPRAPCLLPSASRSCMPLSAFFPLPKRTDASSLETRGGLLSPRVPSSSFPGRRSCRRRISSTSLAPSSVSLCLSPVSAHHAFDSSFDCTPPDVSDMEETCVRVPVPCSSLRCTDTRTHGASSDSNGHRDRQDLLFHSPRSGDCYRHLSGHFVCPGTFLSSTGNLTRRRRVSPWMAEKTQSSRFLLGGMLLFSLALTTVVEAIICRIDASEGLLAAATAAGSATAALDIYSLPLCRSPYLVNSAIPPRDSPHIGLYAGGVIDIDLELLPSPSYVNNLPLDHPRFQQPSATLRTKGSGDTSDNLPASKAPQSDANSHNAKPSPRRVLSEDSPPGGAPSGFVEEVEDDAHLFASSSFKPSSLSSRLLHPSSSPSPSSSFSSLPSFAEVLGSAASSVISPFKYLTPHLSSAFSSISPTVYYLASSLHPREALFPQRGLSLSPDSHKGGTNTKRTTEEQESKDEARKNTDARKTEKEGGGGEGREEEDEDSSTGEAPREGTLEREDVPHGDEESQRKYKNHQEVAGEVNNTEESNATTRLSSSSPNNGTDILSTEEHSPRDDVDLLSASHPSKEEEGGNYSPLVVVSRPPFSTSTDGSSLQSSSALKERDGRSIGSPVSSTSLSSSSSPSSIRVIGEASAALSSRTPSVSSGAEGPFPRGAVVFSQEKGRQRELSALAASHKSSEEMRGRGLGEGGGRGLREADYAVRAGDDLVHEVNNTYVLIMNHFQLLFLEQNEDWVPSFTAPDGVVADSYLPAFKRLPFSSNRMRVRVRVPKRDRYAVMLLNADGLDLRLKGSITFTNPDGGQLSVEQIPLPNTLFALMILYLLTVAFILVCMLVIRRRKWSPVHFLMLGNFLFSALSFGLDWRQAVYVQQHGMRSPTLWLTSRVCQKIHDIIALMTFILIALGWKTLRSHLSRIEIQFVTGLCVISLYLGLFEIILGGFQGTRYILHALGYICVLVAINANLALLHSYIADATLSPATGELYHKFDGYKTYRWIFFLYLLKPVSLVFFKLTFLNPVYEQLLSWDEWVFVFVDNFMDYLIYVGLLYAFRPVGAMRVFRDFSPENASGSGTGSSGSSAWPG